MRPGQPFIRLDWLVDNADQLARRQHSSQQLLRRLHIVCLAADGHTNQEIAKMLFISVRTAETHRAHIMQKLRLTSRAELVRYAISHGLLDALTPAIQ